MRNAASRGVATVRLDRPEIGNALSGAGGAYRGWALAG